LVELASRQGRVGADVSSLRSAVGGAYPGECDFSIGFLFARRANTMGGGREARGKRKEPCLSPEHRQLQQKRS